MQKNDKRAFETFHYAYLNINIIITYKVMDLKNQIFL